MRRLALPLTVSLLAACGPLTSVDDERYHDACASAGDCVAIAAGDTCAICACPNAAIAIIERSRFDDDFRWAQQFCGPRPAVACAPCKEPDVACVEDRCVIR